MYNQANTINLTSITQTQNSQRIWHKQIKVFRQVPLADTVHLKSMVYCLQSNKITENRKKTSVY